MQKIVVAITGASGSIYARLLLTKLSQMKDQVAECSVVMTDNAKDVWQTELGNADYNNTTKMTLMLLLPPDRDNMPR